MPELKTQAREDPCELRTAFCEDDICLRDESIARHGLEPSRYDALSDNALYAAFKEYGDAGAFGALVARHQEPLRYFLVRRLGSSADVDDVLQEVWTSVATTSSFDEVRSFKSWLYKIASNQAIDLQRYQSRRHSVSLESLLSDGGGPTPFDLPDSRSYTPWFAAAAKESAKRILDVVLTLQRAAVGENPPRGSADIELFLAIYAKQMSYAEAAAHFDLNIGTVKSRLHKAVNEVKDALARAGLSLEELVAEGYGNLNISELTTYAEPTAAAEAASPCEDGVTQKAA